MLKTTVDKFFILYAIAVAIFAVHAICCDKIPAKDADAFAKGAATGCQDIGKATEAACTLTGKACPDAGDAGDGSD